MKLSKITSAVLAFAIGAALGTAGHASTTSYNEGDLLIGFEQQNGSGGVTSNNYVFDLGSVSNFIGASAPLTFNLPTADLVSAFGSGWASNTGNVVQWGVIGASDLNSTLTLGSVTLQKNTLFYTQGQLNVGTQSIAPATASNSSQKTINTNIQNFGNDFNGQTASTAGVNGAVIASNDAAGWSANSPATTSFGSGKDIEQPSSGSYTGPTNSELDLYQLNNTTSTPGSKAILLGDFTLSNAGVLTFTEPAAVPEPSAYALGAIGAALFVVLRRRKVLAA